MENNTGIIKKENCNIGKFRCIHNNLYELISAIEPSIIDYEE